MKKKKIFQSLLYHKGSQLALALFFAFGLLFIPITAKSFTGVPAPAQPNPLSRLHLSSSQPHQAETIIDLARPFAVPLLQATNGLTITKSAPAEVDQGGILTYTLVITNNTGSEITDGFVGDSLSSEVSCNPAENPVTSPPTWDFLCTSGVAVWTINSPIADGATVQVAYRVNVTQPLTDGYEIINDDYFISPNDDSPIFGPPIVTLVRAPQWLITKTVSSSSIQPDEILIYTITATNIGHLVTSGDYEISDTIPNLTTLVEAPGATETDPLTWTFNNSLAALGGSRIVTYSVRVDSPLSTGNEIVNDDYTVSGGNAYAAATNAPVTVTVDSPADLSISKTASANPVKIGQVLTYTLTVTNTSSTGQAENVVVTDTLPAEVTFQSASFLGAVQGTITTTGNNPIIWSLDDPLGPEDSAQMRVVVQVKPISVPFTITNNYEASASNAVPVSDSMDVGVAPGNPSSVVLTMGSTTMQSCETTPVTVKLLDSGGNPVPGQPVSLGVVAMTGNGSLNPLFPGNTDINGVVTSTFKALATGTITILGWWTPSFSTVQDSAEIEIIGPPVPDQLVLNVAPNPLYAGGHTAVVTATLSNCLGGLVENEQIDFTLDDISLASFSGNSASASDTTDSNGQATATLSSTPVETASGTVPITGTFGDLQDVVILNIQPEPTAVLTVTKTAIPANGATVMPESTIDYTILLTNTGDATATNVVLTDTLPASVEFVSIISSTTGAGTISGPAFPGGNDLRLLISQLEPNRRVAATIRVTVTAAISGTTLSNQAQARSNTTPEITSNIVRHTVITSTVTSGNIYLPLVLK